MYNSPILIDAVITTLQPYACALPKPKSNSIEQIHTNHDHFPLMAVSVDEAGKKQYTGYIPAGQLRGILRRGAAHEAMVSAKESGNPYDMFRAYQDILGQMKDSEDKKKKGANEAAEKQHKLLETLKMREENAICDLFGASLALSSRLLVGHFCPATPVMPDYFSSVRRDLDEHQIGLMDEASGLRVLQRGQANSERAAAAGLVNKLKREVKKTPDGQEQLKEQLKEQLAAAEAQVEEAKADMDGMTNSSQTLIGFWALPAGLELRSRMVINQPKARDIDLMIEGLDAFSRNPRMGAQHARGCGEVRGKFTFTQDGMTLMIVEIGGYKEANVVELQKFAA